MTQPAPRRFGAYEILHELKTGGMGAVLLARRRGPGTFEQLVAIKTIRPEYAAAAHVRAMFLDEAAILARLHHPGIATVHDFGEDGATLYMVMEYVSGLAFRELAEYRPPPLVLARVVAEACRGLQAAHELRDLSGTQLGLVHRDISPDNLMLGFDGHVKVIDFGIALVKNRQAPVTEFGTLKGKPPYMSPEQVKNESIDRRSDVWALAVVLWELLTQQALFDGDSIYAVAIAVQEKTILPPSQVIGEPLPLGLDAAVMNALDRDPARRTQSAAAFAEELEQVIQSAGGETLEAWADRALATPRADHRVWIANVVSGHDLPKPIVGRATGQVTQVAPDGQTQLAAAPPIVPDVAETAEPPRTSIGGTQTHDADALSRPPRNRLAPLVLALLALLVVGGGVYVATRTKSTAIVVARDAAAQPADAAPLADATEPLDAELAPLDATALLPAPIDAGHRTARPAPRDAAPLPAAPDAAVVRATGSGFITIRYKPGVYANISIDGAAPVAGPIIRKKLGAGKHTITFHEPKEGDVLDTQVVEVTDGASLDVLQR